MPAEKLRFRFRKTGRLRLLSHLDLVRSLERMARRAEIPFARTQGFHPAPRIVFAQSLSLGLEGWNEVLEVELTEPRDAEDTRERLNAQAPEGLSFESVRELGKKDRAATRRMVYRLDVPTQRIGDLADRCAEIEAGSSMWVSRWKPKPRKLNIRPYLRSLCTATDDRGPCLLLDLWVTTTGTARADELLTLLRADDLPASGSTLARSELQVHDETPANEPDAPPDAAPETAPLEPTAATAIEPDEPNEPEWGLGPGGPVVE